MACVWSTKPSHLVAIGGLDTRRYFACLGSGDASAGSAWTATSFSSISALVTDPAAYGSHGLAARSNCASGATAQAAVRSDPEPRASLDWERSSDDHIQHTRSTGGFARAPA